MSDFTNIFCGHYSKKRTEQYSNASSANVALHYAALQVGLHAQAEWNTNLKASLVRVTIRERFLPGLALTNEDSWYAEFVSVGVASNGVDVFRAEKNNCNLGSGPSLDVLQIANIVEQWARVSSEPQKIAMPTEMLLRIIA